MGDIWYTYTGYYKGFRKPCMPNSYSEPVTSKLVKSPNFKVNRIWKLHSERSRFWKFLLHARSSFIPNEQIFVKVHLLPILENRFNNTCPKEFISTTNTNRFDGTSTLAIEFGGFLSPNVSLLVPKNLEKKSNEENTVDGRNPANQLRLVVCPIIYRVLRISGGCLGFLPSTVWNFERQELYPLFTRYIPDGCWTGFLQVKYQLRNHHSVARFSLPEATKNIGIRMPKRSRGLRSMLSLASPEKNKRRWYPQQQGGLHL